MNTATFEEVFTKAGIIPEWIERGVEKGIEKGIERGIERGVERTAKNLLATGMPVEKIAQVTELPVEKIQTLRYQIADSKE
jgi:predicted transposase/invertase (TIGR01784 family)